MDFRFKIVDFREDPVQGALLRLFTSDPFALVDSGFTDSDGNITFDIDPDDEPFEVYVSGTPQISTMDNPTMVMPSQMDFLKLPVMVHDMPMSDIAYMCRCAGRDMKNLSGELLDTKVILTPISIPLSIAGIGVLGTEIHLRIKDGFSVVDLPMTGIFSVEVPELSYRNVTIIPAYPGADLADIIFPRPRRIRYADIDYELSMSVGETKNFGFELIYESGGRIAFPDILDRFSDAVPQITAQSSDADVVSVALSAGVVTLTAHTVGGATIAADAIVSEFESPGDHLLEELVVVVS